jgi:hypothetical protein
MEAFWVRPMSRFPPLKFQIYPVILVVLATKSYAYQLPGEAPADDNRFVLGPLQLGLSNTPIKSSIHRQGDNAATMKYQLGGKEGFSISSNYSSRMEDPFDTSGELEKDGFWDLSLRSPQSGALPGMKIDFSTGGFDGATGNEFNEETRHMFNVDTKGKVGILNYGARYTTVGANYAALGKKNKIKDKDKGKETIHSWVGKSFGDLFLSQFITQTESNIGRADKPLINESLVGTSASYTLHHWPYIGASVSQATGTRKTGDSGFEVPITSTAGSLSMSHKTWSANLSVDRTMPNAAPEQTYGQPDSTGYYLGGSIYPSKTLSFTPYVYMSEDVYTDYGATTKSLSTAFSLTYAPARKNYRFKAYASNDTVENLDWGMDTNYFYSEAGIEWDLAEHQIATRRLSLTIGYDGYEDKVYSGSSSSNYSVKLSFRSYSLGSIFGFHTRHRRNSSSFFADINGETDSHLYPEFP